MKAIKLQILLVTMCFMSCGQTEKPAPIGEQEAHIKLKCQLPRIVDGSIALGFPKVAGLAPSLGELNMTVLFVDFSDVPAAKSVDSVFAIINPIAPDFFSETSYGRLNLKLTPNLEWLRLSKPSEHYGTAIYYGQPHLDFIQEAVDLADDKVDFSQTDIVLVMTTPEADKIRQGPTFKSIDSTYHIKADGASISTGITSGYDLNLWGGIWLAHETGHTFGLPDLYHFGTDSLNRYVGTYSLMGTCDAHAPGYFAFERWVLGWLDDDQIYCHDIGEMIIELTAVEQNEGMKAIIVPLDNASALVVESRRKIGFDHRTSEGALVYLVDTRLPGGSGPIRVKPGVESKYEFLQDAPLVPGEKYSYQHVDVEVLKAGTFSDEIKVTVNTP